MERSNEDAAMERSNEDELVELGKKLAQLPQSKDALLKLLKELASLLAYVDQSAPEETLHAMSPCKEALVRPELLQHKDKDVRLLVATCASEIMRIEAPLAPYNDDILKELFELIVGTFRGLDDMGSPSFTKRVSILETVASIKSCVLMLDLECDVEDLVFSMFRIFFSKAREDHPPNVLKTMLEIMVLVVCEYDDEIPKALLHEILSNLLKDHKKVSPAAYRLAVEVVRNCAANLEPHVRGLLTSVHEGKGSGFLEENYHDIIYEIYRCAPQILVAVIPNLNQELVVDDETVRLKAVELLGRLFSLPGQNVAQEYRHLILELGKRFTDKSVPVRLAVIECARKCLLANPTGVDLSEISNGLGLRLLDPDEGVRIRAVSAICDVVKANLKAVPMEIVRNVALRLRDKKTDVRTVTLQNLTEVYATYCSKSPVTFTTDQQFEWIPGKILKCNIDKEFRPQGIEIVFSEELFPPELSIDERAKHWIAMFSNLEKNELKALERVLTLKQRFQLEMQSYLSMRQKLKEEENSELEKKMQACFKGMAITFVDYSKAEENIQKLHHMKDNSIFKTFATLLNPSTTYADARTLCDELLKRIGVKHPQYEFLKMVATRCSFLLFGREHVASVLKALHSLKSTVNKEMVSACISLLVVFAGFFPTVMEGAEEDVLNLLKDNEDDIIKDGAVQILSKAGHCLRDKIADSRSSVNLTLEKLCLEGSRKQAKYAVSAIAALSTDSGIKSLSVLYGHLLDTLDSRGNLPTVLQSLGCIAQIAMPVFETREPDVVSFIVENLLRRESPQDHVDGSKSDWESKSEECLTKIYGLKALVKSFLPNKDAHLRQRLKDMLPVLLKLLRFGSISEEIKSSDIDKAHLRLAAAKAVLRLSRSWDKDIPPDMFHYTVLTIQDSFVEVRQKYLSKTQQYLKAQHLPHKYASAFSLCAADCVKEIVAEGKRCMVEFVDACRREAGRLRQGGQSEGLQHYPEYVLIYVVHVLAHHPSFPESSSADATAFEPFYRQLFSYLQALLGQEVDGKREDNNLPAILEIFRTIKKTEDAVDASKSQNLYVLCDIGLQIAKDLGAKRFSETYSGTVPLPSAFFKLIEVKAEGSALPACLTEDVFARFRSAMVTKVAQPTSRGHKRGKKATEETSADEDDDDDPPPKRSRNNEVSEASDKKLGKSSMKIKVSRGRKPNKSSNDREEDNSTKATNMSEDDVEDIQPKRKRGRPSKEDQARRKQQRTEAQNEEAPVPKKRGRPKGSSKKLKVETDSPATSADVKGNASETTSAKQSGKKERDQRTPRDSDADRGKKMSSEDGQKQEVAEGATTPKRKKPTPSASDKTTPSKNGAEEGDELVGRRVKVWWPMDKAFYKGRIESYNAKKKQHHVVYDDGDQETLTMKKERWEFIDEPKQDATRLSPSSQHGKSKKKTSVNALVREDEPQGSSQKMKASSPKGKRGIAQKASEKKETSDDGQHLSENDTARKGERGSGQQYSKVNGSNKTANGDAVEAESSQPAASVEASKGTESDGDEPLESYRSRKRKAAV